MLAVFVAIKPALSVAVISMWFVPSFNVSCWEIDVPLFFATDLLLRMSSYALSSEMVASRVMVLIALNAGIGFKVISGFLLSVVIVCSQAALLPALSTASILSLFGWLATRVTSRNVKGTVVGTGG